MVNIAAMVARSEPLTDPPPAPAAGIDPRRYRKVRRFLLRVVLHALWWDLLLNAPFLRRFRRPALPRWVAIARRFRFLAVEMGGVLIKLGQFLSTRVDLLPYEVTRELGGLQDEVPAAAFTSIVAQIEEDFDRPLDRVFARFDAEPIGAASLAQVHKARLPGGEEVVVKVLRPGIDVLVETDLAVVALAVRWLKFWKRIRQRVDLDRLREEFTTTTHHELDMVAEGHNAEHFAEDFADDAGVTVPKVYWEQSARRTLTLENVGYIKIGDLEALEEAGIDRTAVAERLYSTYLKQIFHHSFVHADPHPGNLFVRPLPGDGKDRSEDAGDRAAKSRPFQIVFVDFGMVATIPQRLRAAVREYLIGFGTRDAYRIVRAYQRAGMLLPGVDLKRLEEAHEAILQHFWGVPISELRNVVWNEMGYLLREYRDLILEAPFQVQVELLFVERA
ncbi:MAG: AarF/ABC1/UbiB kinase family protein, partial [bacterium]|nr:AarF/ABC1/UbiB kinase family protein [bacterium]